MRQRLVDCSLFCVYMGPVPNESWVSLKADSGDNVTNFHFKASGFSGGGRRLVMERIQKGLSRYQMIRRGEYRFQPSAQVQATDGLGALHGKISD